MKRLLKKFHMERMRTSTFVEECLRAHNKYRAIHGSPKLQLSQEITTYAQHWADTLARKNSFEHSRNCEYGENLFTASETDPNWVVRPSDPVRSWYSEIELYSFDATVIPKNVATGRFTQIIWKATRRLGVGVTLRHSNRVYIVCNYEPSGNIAGHFAENVLPPVRATQYENTFLWERAFPSTHNYKTL